MTVTEGQAVLDGFGDVSAGASNATDPARVSASSTPADTPPKPKRSHSKKADAGPARPKAPGRPPRDNLRQRLEDFYTTIAVFVSTAGTATGSVPLALDGLALMEHAPTMAAAWDRLAAENPRVKAALERFLTASAVAEVIGAHVPVVAVLVANHAGATLADAANDDGGDAANPLAFLHDATGDVAGT